MKIIQIFILIYDFKFLDRLETKVHENLLT
jgi:hypothetical protein